MFHETPLKLYFMKCCERKVSQWILALIFFCCNWNQSVVCMISKLIFLRRTRFQPANIKSLSKTSFFITIVLSYLLSLGKIEVTKFQIKSISLTDFQLFIWVVTKDSSNECRLWLTRKIWLQESWFRSKLLYSE